MKESERRKRDMRIVELYEDGTSPHDIGKKVGLRADMVRKILKGRGFVFDYHLPSTTGYTIWEQSDDKRRRAIWERAKRAAHAALQEVA